LQEQIITDGQSWNKHAGHAGASDIEDAGGMQKEKPPFQAIPNWRPSTLIATATASGIAASDIARAARTSRVIGCARAAAVQTEKAAPPSTPRISEIGCGTRAPRRGISHAGLRPLRQRIPDHRYGGDSDTAYQHCARIGLLAVDYSITQTRGLRNFIKMVARAANVAAQQGGNKRTSP